MKDEFSDLLDQERKLNLSISVDNDGNSRISDGSD